MTRAAVRGPAPGTAAQRRPRKGVLNVRALTAFIVTWAFAIAVVTGIVLYIVPHGRVAYWTDWGLAGLEKDTWGGIHIIFGAVFIVAGILHLYFNWKPFKKHLTERAAGHVHVKREVVIASGATVVVLAAAIAEVPPVSWLFDLNETVKQSWVSSPDLEPPYGHAEESSLRTLARRTGLDLDVALTRLSENGIAADGPGDSLKAIARRNGLTPMAVYEVIRPVETETPKTTNQAHTPASVEQQFEGTGIGRRTLADMITVTGIDPDTAVERLTTVGLDAEMTHTLRRIADAHGLTPVQVLQAILIEGFEPTEH